MTHLQCSVQECMYNAQNGCCAHGIHVEGSYAERCEGTCCETFANRSGAQNAAADSTPNRCMTISCDAKHCVYNQNSKCTAESVDINGANCQSGDQTRCNTFRRR